MRILSVIGAASLSLVGFATGCAAESAQPAPSSKQQSVTNSYGGLTATAIRIDDNVSEVYVTVQKTGAWVMTSRCDAAAKSFSIEHVGGTVTKAHDGGCAPDRVAAGALAVAKFFAAKVAPAEFPQDGAGCDIVGAQSWTHVASDEGWFNFGVTTEESRSCCFSHDSCMAKSDCSFFEPDCYDCHAMVALCFAAASLD